jgi:hypothetical protein
VRIFRISVTMHHIRGLQCLVYVLSHSFRVRYAVTDYRASGGTVKGVASNGTVFVSNFVKICHPRSKV